MRRLLIAVPFICLAMPVAAQQSGVSPEIDKVLVCATMFSLKAEDDKAIGDDGGHLEWSMRADELASRGGLMLGEAGFDAQRHRERPDELRADGRARSRAGRASLQLRGLPGLRRVTA